MKWLPSLFAVLGMIITPLVPSIQHGISLHPIVAVIVAGVLGIVSHFSPSPTSGT